MQPVRNIRGLHFLNKQKRQDFPTHQRKMGKRLCQFFFLKFKSLLTAGKIRFLFGGQMFRYRLQWYRWDTTVAHMHIVNSCMFYQYLHEPGESASQFVPFRIKFFLHLMPPGHAIPAAWVACQDGMRSLCVVYRDHSTHMLDAHGNHPLSTGKEKDRTVHNLHNTAR